MSRGPACHEVTPPAGGTRQCRLLPLERRHCLPCRLMHTVVSNTPQGISTCRRGRKHPSLRLFTCLEHGADNLPRRFRAVRDGCVDPAQLCRMSTGCSDHQQPSMLVLVVVARPVEGKNQLECTPTPVLKHGSTVSLKVQGKPPGSHGRALSVMVISRGGFQHVRHEVTHMLGREIFSSDDVYYLPSHLFLLSISEMVQQREMALEQH